MKHLALFLTLAFIIATTPTIAATPLPVVASFSILGDMVQEIGGDAITVTTLVGPDSDTHTYQPTPEDAKKLTHAQLVFVNGLSFEGWMQRLAEASGTKAETIITSTGVTPRSMEDDGKTVTDPHAWQNLANGRIYVKNIATALEHAIPDEAKAIAKRAAAYDAAIAHKDEDTRKAFAAIPATQRKIITSHDAFGYFGAAYGITFLAPVGMNTEAEASAKDVAKLMDQIKTEGVQEVFIENMTNPKLIEQIAKDTGATMGGELYADALSPPDGKAATYLAMFDNNVPKLKAAMEKNR